MHRRYPTSRALVRALALGLTIASAARSDDRALSTADRVRAQQLFDSALADVEGGLMVAACAKFAASQEIDPKTSTLLNLGSCYESTGRVASAWGAFREAEGLARRVRRPDLEATARARAEALAPRLLSLTIVVPQASRAPGLVISRDGAKLTTEEWGIGIPVDEGEHEVIAEAPGRKPWRERVVVRGASRSLAVPSLAVAPRPIAEQPATSTSWWTPTRTAGAASSVTGLTSLVGGLVAAAIAKSNYDDARAQCRAIDDCPGSAVRDGEHARSLATAATVVIVSGAALLTIGSALLVFAPQARPRRDGQVASSARAWLGIGCGSLGLVGRW